MTTKSPFDNKGDWLPWSSSTPPARQDGFTDDFTVECNHLVSNGRIYLADIRIAKGAARYGRFKRLRNWLYHRAPWLPSWVTGWVTIRYRRPTKPFPDA